MPKATAPKKSTRHKAGSNKAVVHVKGKEGSAEEKREWLNPSEAMKYLGVSRTALYKLMNGGILPFFTIRGLRKRRLKKEDLDALLERGGSVDDKPAE